MKSPSSLGPLRRVAALLLVSGVASAAPVTVPNFSFETPVTASYTNTLTNWTGTGGANNVNAFVENIANFKSDGVNHLGMELGYDVWQDLGAVYEANTKYTLTVGVGNRDANFTVAGNQSTYGLADSTGAVYDTAVRNATTVAVGTFADAPALTVYVPAGSSAVGKTIRVLLRARGAGRSHFDNVRLDASPMTSGTVATSITTAATNVASSTATLNGSVVDIGAAAPTVTFFYGTTDGGSTPASWTSNVAVSGAQSGNFSANLTGLVPATTYFYRVRSVNAGGTTWSVPAGSFTTTATPATVQNLAASGVSPSGALLGAQVLTTGGTTPTVIVYYGPTDGETTPANWASSVSLGATNTGGTKQVTGLTQNTTYYFRAAATNAGGTSWAPSTGSFQTLTATLATVVNKPADGIAQTTARIRGSVTQTGGEAPQATLYWGTTDGGTTAGSWQNAAPQGWQANDFSETLRGLAPGTQYFYRAAATNGAGTAWAAQTASFTTPVLMAPGLSGQKAASVTDRTVALQVDVTTGGSPTTLTFHWGTTDGGTTAANWQNTAPTGLQSGGVSRFLGGLTPGTTYYFRAAATNAVGTTWAPVTTTFATRAGGAESVVINEIFYNRPNRNLSAVNTTAEFLPATKAVEFIELHNPTAAALDLSGWRLDGGVSYVFPAGSTLAAGGYTVVAQNLTDFQAQFGFAPRGPWIGTLSGNKDTIRVLNAASAVIDEVNYESGFPWPTAARGGGESMELINPALDHNLGGSWRSSVYVAAPSPVSLAGQWRWRKGTTEASTPVSAWRLADFVEDGTWATGQAPFGYGLTGINTTLDDMRTTTTDPIVPGYQCIFMRKTVNLSSVASSYQIRLFIDDAATIWVNGTQVATRLGPTNPTINATIAAATDSATAQVYTVPGSAFKTGENIIAVQAWNIISTNSDFKVDLEINPVAPTGAVKNPTPGRGNSTFVNNAPPAVRQVVNTPAQPKAGEPVVITAKITDPEGVGAVTLQYQAVNPGSYIRRSDAAYSATWTNLPMVDDGTGGDAVAGDSIYSVTIPASVQTNRRLVRYRIQAADLAASPVSVQVPYADDEQLNFAYFVYNGVPGWNGAMRPSAFSGFPATPVQNFPATLLQSIQPFHVIANATDVTNSQYNSGSNDVVFWCTFVYDGTVYDNVQLKNRGIGSIYVSGKNKWKFLFNRGRNVQMRDNWGRKFKQTWNEIPLDANASPWAAVHRGSAGVEEASSYRAYELAGVNSLRTTYAHLRIIDDAAEFGATQYDGDFWGLYLALEPTEGNFVDERNLPDGNLFSIEGSAGDKQHQSPTQVSDGSDWTTFRTQATTTGQNETWYRTNENLTNLYTFLGMSRLIGNVDVRPGDNFRYYRSPADNRWSVIPYDLDMMYIAAHHWGGAMDGVTVAGFPDTVRAIMRHPALAREYRNRCRELLSLMASDPSPTGGQIGQLIDEYAQIVNPTGVALTWADADAAMWNLHPRSAGGGGNTGQSSHKGNFFRALYLDGTRGGLGGTSQTGSWIRNLADPDGDGFSDHEGIMQWFVNYATNTYPAGAATWLRKATSASGGGTDNDANRQKGYGYKYLEWESLYGGYVNAVTNPATTLADLTFPTKPTITYTGDPAFAANNLTFSSSAFSPSATGGTTFAAMQWRIGEISAPGMPFHDPTKPRVYEIENLWTSAELTAFNASARVPASAVRTGHTYRARVRHKDANGTWSYWSEPYQFVAGQASVGVYLDNLMITEVNYNPGPATQAEINAGFATQDFEFIELKNIGTQPLDLTDVRFTKGVNVDIPAGTTLAPGGFALVVKNLAAFRARYGTSHDSQIVGSFPDDSLSNSGEQLKLAYGSGEPIHDFVYSDAAPWPTAADGLGYTMVLANPASKPDHALPTSWKASAALLGSPGADDGMSYAAWSATYPGTSDPAADTDADTSSNWLEYALGSNPLVPGVAQLPTAAVNTLTIAGTPDRYLVITFTRPIDRPDVHYSVQLSEGLAAWTDDAVLASSTPNPDGTVTEVWRSPQPVSSRSTWFIRLKVN